MKDMEYSQLQHISMDFLTKGDEIYTEIVNTQALLLDGVYTGLSTWTSAYIHTTLEMVKGLFFNGFQLQHPVSLHDVRRFFWSLPIDSHNITGLGIWITGVTSLNPGRPLSTENHHHMADIPNTVRPKGCATTCWGLISCFCLPAEMSLRYVRRLALMLSPRAHSVSFLPGVNQWHLP